MYKLIVGIVMAIALIVPSVSSADDEVPFTHNQFCLTGQPCPEPVPECLNCDLFVVPPFKD